MISKPDKNEAALQELLKEISSIDQSQREELKIVREAELEYAASQDRTSTGSSLYDSAAENDENLSSSGEDQSAKQDASFAEGSSPPCPAEAGSEQAEASVEELEEEKEQAEEASMDWEDLSREQWTESDRLLQKIEKVGPKVVQRDFLSCVGKQQFTI